MEEGAEAHREPTKAEPCAEWLVGMLAEAGEPVEPKEVVKRATEEGFTRGVVYRARKAVEGMVVDTVSKHLPDNRWAAAEQAGNQCMSWVDE